MFVPSLDDHWKLRSADLALKLLKVEVSCASNVFLFDFDFDPMSKAVDVDSPT